MKKQELIQLHQMYAWIQSEFESRGIQIDTTDYDELGVTPISVQKSKTDHKEASMELSSALAESSKVSKEEEEVIPA